jgi:hypothetical protein
VLELEMEARVIVSLRGTDSDGGQLTMIAKELEAVLKVAVEAQDALDKSMLEQAKNDVLEALSRKEYVDKYNAVYHNACGDIGRAKANNLFQVIRTGKKKEAENPKGGELPICAAA